MDTHPLKPLNPLTDGCAHELELGPLTRLASLDFRCRACDGYVRAELGPQMAAAASIEEICRQTAAALGGSYAGAYDAAQWALELSGALSAALSETGFGPVFAS